MEKDELIVKTVTPIVVYSTDSTTKYTVYYSPEDIEFYEEIQNNAYRKYQAYYGVEPDSYVEIKEASDMTAKKLVTKYQGSYIEAWYGNFILFGKRKYLDFLYQTGLGSKNSQGFGMFNII